jgi:NAD(P)H-dependent FMN reductase
MTNGKTLTVLSICGSPRKGSYNAMVARALPALAPEGMTITPAPSFAEFPLYNADIQNSTGFPTAVTTLADAIRAADGVIFTTPEYNFTIPGGLKNALDWVSRLKEQPFVGKRWRCSRLRGVRSGAPAFSMTCARRWRSSMHSCSTSRKSSSATACRSSTRPAN